MVKVGDIIDGRKVTKVFELCGGIAYQSVPAETEIKTEVKTEEETEKEVKPKKRIVRKKKEQ